MADPKSPEAKSIEVSPKTNTPRGDGIRVGHVMPEVIPPITEFDARLDFSSPPSFAPLQVPTSTPSSTPTPPAPAPVQSKTIEELKLKSGSRVWFDKATRATLQKLVGVSASELDAGIVYMMPEPGRRNFAIFMGGSFGVFPLNTMLPCVIKHTAS